jgi:hypothetical protein
MTFLMRCFISRRSRSFSSLEARRFPFRRPLGMALLPGQIGEGAREEEAEKPDIGQIGGRGLAQEFRLRPEAEGPQAAADGEHLVGVCSAVEGDLFAGAEEGPAVDRRTLEDLHRNLGGSEGADGGAEEIGGAERCKDESGHRRRRVGTRAANRLKDEEPRLVSAGIAVLAQREEAAHGLLCACRRAGHRLLASGLAQHIEAKDRLIARVERLEIDDGKIGILGRVHRPDMEIAAIEGVEFLLGRGDRLGRHALNEAEALQAAISLAQAELIDIGAEGIERGRHRGGFDESLRRAQERELRLDLGLDARIKTVRRLFEP